MIVWVERELIIQQSRLMRTMHVAVNVRGAGGVVSEVKLSGTAGKRNLESATYM